MKKQAIIVSKRDLKNQETWRYAGQIIEQVGSRITLEAFFNRPDMPFHGIVFKHMDRFVETFYTDRWFNVFAVHDRDDGKLKAWYCNIARPAVLEKPDGGPLILAYVDLALDLLVFPPDANDPTGRQLVLDQSEFDALALDPAVRQRARAALAELQERFKNAIDQP